MEGAYSFILKGALMRYHAYAVFRLDFIMVKGIIVLAERFVGRRCPHVVVDSCAKMGLSHNGNGRFRLFGVPLRTPLPFSSKKSVVLAHTLGGSRTARVKIVLVKKQGGNLARKESTHRVEIAPAEPNAPSPQKAADRL